ncbi:nucleotidyltransferase family protein [Gluconacetobacter tumulicola]|uniref:Nucleotidyltransferase family protein n=1 Tax=Gluconacetobacter tumulicola TaxID=1017177 RepID=A0A7W4JFY7_9PROT|nr:nucleotidyltransferase family protein [Gluconacetobacter tumulicola]MBB2180534.1 nucleotidyltransferase family protein [Gluconacetobacter tumulicola]
MQTALAIQFSDTVLQNPFIRDLSYIWEQIELDNCWLVAGCLAQTIWNNHFGLPVNHGISDLDIVYFDADDTSALSEQRNAERIRTMLSHIAVWIDVKNEARVHLWYKEKFGYPISPYRSVEDAIDTFPTTATAIGIKPGKHGSEVYAPFGLSDLLNGIVRPNKRQITADIYEAKVEKWLKRWPYLTIIPWNAE